MENILLMNDGYIKLADFGISKNLALGGTTQSFAGTVKYMAPQIVKGREYGHEADWWAFGVLIYIMTFDRYPFVGVCDQAVYEAICGTNVSFPEGSDQEIMSIIKKVYSSGH